jgi:hypothetical protein
VLTSCIFALVYCVIEATSEVLGLYRQIKFYYSPLMRLSRAIEKIEQTSEEDRCQRLQHVVNKIFALASSDLTAEARTQALSCLHIVAKSKQSGKAIGSQDFFELCAGIRLISSQLFRQKYLNPQNVNAIVELARRVGTKPLQELELKLRLNEVRHRSNQKQSLEVEKNDRIFTHLNQQAWKKIFIHQIGLLAVVFTTIAIALTLFGGGAVSFYAIGLTFSIVRHLITYGVTNEGHGWHFRLLPCLPQLMTRKIAAPPCIEIELTELKKYTAVGMKL